MANNFLDYIFNHAKDAPKRDAKVYDYFVKAIINLNLPPEECQAAIKRLGQLLWAAGGNHGQNEPR